MSLSLHEKLKYIDSHVLFQRVLYDLCGLEHDQTTQIHCMFHNDGVASSRLYINGDGLPHASDGHYCWVCGNSSTSGIAIKTLGGIPQALEYFEREHDIDFNEIQGISKDLTTKSNKEISLAVKKCKKNSINSSWSVKDINHLMHFVKNYGDKFHKIRLESLENKLKVKNV